MSSSDKIQAVDLGALAIVRWPDPRLNEICTPIDRFDDALRRLVERMFELMFAGRGVGLAGSQVGVTVRLFIASPTFTFDDQQIFINPQIISAEGSQTGEEGCLSFPDITAKIKRSNIVTVRAMGLDGAEFERTGEALAARIFQHEIDHLDGRLLIDRMPSLAKLANRRALKDLRDQFND